VAIFTIMLVEFFGNQFFPPPRGYDMGAGSALSLPATNLIWPVIGWFLGALAGGWVAVRISGERWTVWAIVALVLGAIILNFAMITHPLWMMIVGPLAAIAGGLVGQRLPKSSTRPPLD
jgi:nitrate/nitrite transporter NarK